MPKRKPELDTVVHSPDLEPTPAEDYPYQKEFEGAVRRMFANATPPDPLKRKPRKKVRGGKRDKGD